MDCHLTPLSVKAGLIFLLEVIPDMKLLVTENGNIVAERITNAHSFFSRLKGLMFTRLFPAGSALHIQPCRSIHTFFMNYAIDVVFVDSHFEVVAVLEHMEPKRVSKVYSGAVSAIELPAGTIDKTGIKPGMILRKVKGEEINYDRQAERPSS